MTLLSIFRSAPKPATAPLSKSVSLLAGFAQTATGTQPR